MSSNKEEKTSTNTPTTANIFYTEHFTAPPRRPTIQPVNVSFESIHSVIQVLLQLLKEKLHGEGNT